MGVTWKQERPGWCPHPDCGFKRRVMDDLCGGSLPKPEPHGSDLNTHRICIYPDSNINAGEPIFDLEVNSSDLDWFRWILDSLDGKKTSWLSELDEMSRAHKLGGLDIFIPEDRRGPQKTVEDSI